MLENTDRLAEIQARTDAATKGPWQLDDSAQIWTPEHDVVADIWEPTSSSGNGEFVAAARSDVPFLLNLARQQQAEIAELQAKLRIRERQLEDMDAGVIA